jgi:S1-C subfamily serine protease
MKGSMMRTLKTFALVVALALGTCTQAFADSPYLGVYLVEETDSKNGALVEGVKEGSPAHKAGIRKGDIILKYNGVATPNGATLIKQILASNPGGKVTMVASRNGWNKNVQLTLGSSNPEAAPTPAPKATPQGNNPGFLGVYLAGGDGKGAHVDGTVKDSPARKMGLKKGDVIVGVNGKSVSDEQDLIAQLKGLKAGTKLKLRVVRDGWGKDVNITLGARPARPAPEGTTPAPKKATPKKATPKSANKRGVFGVALDETKAGVVVDEVQAGSAADKGAIVKGDVVIAVNGKKIGSIDDFAAALKGKMAGETLTVVISRDGWKRTVKVTLAAGN